jgi:hypothetical protein
MQPVLGLAVAVLSAVALRAVTLDAVALHAVALCAVTAALSVFRRFQVANFDMFLVFHD